MNKRIIAVLCLCFSLFMVHAQTEMYPGMAYIDDLGFTCYVEDVTGTSYLLENGQILLRPNCMLSTTTVFREGGKVLLVHTLAVPTWMGLGSMALAAEPAHMTCATTYADNVAPLAVYYEHVDTRVSKNTKVTYIYYVYRFEWTHDTVMVWNATTDEMLYAGIVNNAEPSSAE